MRWFLAAAGALLLPMAASAAGPHPPNVKPRVLEDVHRPPVIDLGFSGRQPALRPEDLTDLKTILRDDREKSCWANAAALAGGIRSRRSFELLHWFVWRRFRGRVDQATFRAIFLAQSSMGDVAADANPSAEEYLWRAANPAYWDSLPWDASRPVGVLLSKISINELGWTGTKRSEERLVALSQRPYHPQQRSNIAEALRRVREIRRLGREEYEKAREAEAERKRHEVPIFPSDRP